VTCTRSTGIADDGVIAVEVADSLFMKGLRPD
jgi:hypothetical protein